MKHARKKDDTRRRLVARIGALADAIDIEDIAGAYGWPDMPQFDAFVSAWDELINYYRASADTVVDVEILKAYVDYSRLLRDLLASPVIDPQQRAQARSALESLETRMDQVIINLYETKLNL